MKVVLGPLAQSGLETRVGPNLPAAVNTALVYYVGKLNSGRRPPKLPKFLLTPQNEGGPGADATQSPDARPELEVSVDERIEAALVTDAESQGVSTADLAGHAVLVYLAELDLVGDPEFPQSRRVRGFAGPGRRPRRAPH